MRVWVWGWGGIGWAVSVRKTMMVPAGVVCVEISEIGDGF